MKSLGNLNFKMLSEEVMKELPNEIIELIKMNETVLLTAEHIKYKMINEIFENAKHINLELMKYSMELLDKEDMKRKK